MEIGNTALEYLDPEEEGRERCEPHICPLPPQGMLYVDGALPPMERISLGRYGEIDNRIIGAIEERIISFGHESVWYRYKQFVFREALSREEVRNIIRNEPDEAGCPCLPAEPEHLFAYGAQVPWKEQRGITVALGSEDLVIIEKPRPIFAPEELSRQEKEIQQKDEKPERLALGDVSVDPYAVKIASGGPVRKLELCMAHGNFPPGIIFLGVWRVPNPPAHY